MTYSTKVASYLSGVTVSQLHRLAKKNLLTGEFSTPSQRQYSFRDVIALRTIAKLRASHSMQSVSAAVAYAQSLYPEDHLSTITLLSDGKEIFAYEPDSEELIAALRQQGQFAIPDLGNILDAFTNFDHRVVPNLLEPAKGIQVDKDRLGGVPTIAGTRIPYDLVVDLSTDMDPEEIHEWYDSVEPHQVQFALDFDRAIEDNARSQKGAA